LDKLSSAKRKEIAINKLLGNENKELNKARMFEKFRNDHLNTTEIEYHSIEELRQNPPKQKYISVAVTKYGTTPCTARIQPDGILISVTHPYDVSPTRQALDETLKRENNPLLRLI